MRTTLDIDNDVLEAAKELAVREKSTAGRVLSRLARAGLQAPSAKHGRPVPQKNGVPVFPRRGDKVVTLDHVRKLMDEEGV